jgi:hypothetical protein
MAIRGIIETTLNDPVSRMQGTQGEAAAVAKDRFDGGSSGDGHTHLKGDMSTLLDPLGDESAANIAFGGGHQEQAL